uniref:Uncharacterized protein n=1 Tax=Ananas comosus var. bracteatus TaxID=296719 RepID=A0A6V7Q0G4_ANACO|nr:unnamed protein product [Ananas comosus var. bracteatus]
MTMDLINKLMNVVAPPMALVALFLLVPPLYLYKLFVSFLYSLFPENLTDKVVLITSASSGIGEQLAFEYAKKGAALVLVARREGSLQEVAERARDLGIVDHLVNNAGIANVCLFEEAPDVTKFTTRNGCELLGIGLSDALRASAPQEDQREDRSELLASGWLPLPSRASTIKAALINFYETLQIELGNEVGITIATPSFIESR